MFASHRGKINREQKNSYSLQNNKNRIKRDLFGDNKLCIHDCNNFFLRKKKFFCCWFFVHELMKMSCVGMEGSCGVEKV